MGSFHDTVVDLVVANERRLFETAALGRGILSNIDGQSITNGASYAASPVGLLLIKQVRAAYYHACSPVSTCWCCMWALRCSSLDACCTLAFFCTTTQCLWFM